MTEKLELVRGSDNIFRDFGDPDAGLEQARAILAARIIEALDERGLSVRAAERLTGVAASEFSRIRNVKLSRFTIDRMMTILGKLGLDVELTVKVWPQKQRGLTVPDAALRSSPVAGRKASATEGALTQAARRRTPAKTACPPKRKM